MPFLAFVVGGFGYGVVASRIPVPHGATAFWAGNPSSPWLLLAFLAGRSQRSWLWAGLAGALADCAAILGFYAEFLYFHAFDRTAGAPRPQSIASLLTRTVDYLPSWLAVTAPWLEKAVACGVVFGLAGWWWGRSRSLAAGAAVCLAVTLEPFAWFVYLGHVPRPYALWLMEAVAGAVALVWVVASRRIGSAT